MAGQSAAWSRISPLAPPPRFGSRPPDLSLVCPLLCAHVALPSTPLREEDAASCYLLAVAPADLFTAFLAF